MEKIHRRRLVDSKHHHNQTFGDKNRKKRHNTKRKLNKCLTITNSHTRTTKEKLIFGT